MKDSSLFTHVFIRDNAEYAVITCPHCAVTRKLDASKIKNKKKANWEFPAKCQKCGTEFTIGFNFRKFYRKDVELKGNLILDDDDLEIRISDLSMSGLSFSISDPSNLIKDKKYKLLLYLDDKSGTILERNLYVVSISDKRIGARFEELKFYDKELGFFLMP